MLSIIIPFAFFFLGAAIGSFTEVVRVRSSWRQSLSGRSCCTGCGVLLRWYSLVPVISFCALRGRCGSCGVRIPVSHFVAEFLTGGLFVCAYFFLSDPYLFYAVLVSAFFLVPITLTDLERMEIPEHFSVPFTILSLVTVFLVMLVAGSGLLVLNGILLAAPFFLIWLFSRGRAMGLGDAKLALPMGFLLPTLTDVLSVFIFTFWIGALICAGYALYVKARTGSFQLTRRIRIPLAPCMVLAYFLVLFTNVSFLDPLYVIQHTLL